MFAHSEQQDYFLMFTHCHDTALFTIYCIAALVLLGVTLDVLFSKICLVHKT